MKLVRNLQLRFRFFRGFAIWIVNVEYLYRNAHSHLLTVCSLCQNDPNENGADQSSNGLCGDFVLC